MSAVAPAVGDPVGAGSPPGPRPAAERPLVWAAVGVVLLLVVGGAAIAGIENPGQGAEVAGTVATLGAPSFITVLCPNQLIYYLTYFPIAHVSGPPLLTPEFGLSIETPRNGSVAPGGVAPGPNPTLPCSAPIPENWYGVLIRGSGSALATYPTADPATGGWTWSNATTTPVSIGPGESFEMVTDGDYSGSGDRLVAVGVGAASITLAGNTTFPQYEHP